MNPKGDRIAEPGSLNGLLSSGACFLSTLRAGPPTIYVNTVAPVMKPTSLYQLGNGAKNTNPRRRLTSSGSTGILNLSLTLVSDLGRNLSIPMPKSVLMDVPR